MTVGFGGRSMAFAVGRIPTPVVASPAPATSNVACGSPALRSPDRFTPRVMWLDSAFTLVYSLWVRSCSDVGPSFADRPGSACCSLFGVSLCLGRSYPATNINRLNTWSRSRGRIRSSIPSAFRIAKDAPISRVPSLQRHYPPSSLLRTLPTPSRLRLFSRVLRL